MKKLLTLLLLIILSSFAFSNADAQVSVTGAVFGNGNHATLSAAFNAINSNPQGGAFINITINANTNEPFGGAVLLQGAWNSLFIQPSGFRMVTGTTNPGVPLIDLNGADRVTIDGLSNSLTFSNNSISSNPNTSTIRLIGDAINNLITRCTVLGASATALGTNGGTILLSSGISTGNDNNIISFCNIGPSVGGFPTKAINFSGTPSFSNSSNALRNCNIYDYFSATISSAGVYLNGGSTDTEIRDNKFYQTASRTQTTGSPHFAICLDNPFGNNFLVSGNTVGFASSSGTGAYTFTGTANSNFEAISINAGNTTATSVQGNVIAGIAMSGSQSGNFGAARLKGINVLNGLVNIGTVTANTIGSLSSTGSITYTSTSASPSAVIGISLGGTANINANNNNVGGITASNTASGPANIWGIRSTTTGTLTCQNNTIGGTVANSIQSTSTSTSTIVNGIENSGGASTVSANTIRNLTAASGTTAGGYTAPISGIMINVLNFNQTISQNTIHTINNTDTSNATVTAGIYLNSTSITNLVERNFVHSLNANSLGGSIIGLFANGGTVTYQNNMVRLGINGSGSSVTRCLIRGINETGGTNNFYFNSVYIGGSAASGSSSTFAFNSTVTSNTRRYVDNIIVNARSNSGGTGKHYAISAGGTAPLPAGLTSNYNILFVAGTGTVLGLFNSVDRPDLSSWKTATGKDTNSISSDPFFVNPTGNSSTVNLHIGGFTTPVEAAGTFIASVTNDYDGQNRSAFTPTDIGADAGAFYNSLAPIISYTPLSNIGLNAQNLNNVDIADSNGVNGSSGTRPRCYYKKKINTNTFSDNTNSTNGWKYVEAAGSVSPFNFTINNSLVFGGVAGDDTIQYFVVAQDLAPTPNVGINSGTLASTPSSVALTAAAFPVTGAINSYAVLPITVSGALAGNGYYTNLYNAFTSVNSAAQTGANITILVQGNTTEPATGCQLNDKSWNTLSIKPDGGAARTISGSTNPGLPLIKLYSADRVTIDGLNSGGNSLTLSNTSVSSNSGTSTVRFDSSASNNVITRCTILGSSQTYYPTIGGTITFNKNPSDFGNNNNTISFCNIGPAGSNLPATAVYIEGNFVNNQTLSVQDTIRNCNIYDYFSTSSSSAGVYISRGVSNTAVRDNKFYQTAVRTLSSGTYQHSAVRIQNGNDNLLVSGNTIGFSSSSGTGNYQINSTSQLSFYPIHITDAGISGAPSVQGNVISNISFTTSGTAAAFAGIYVLNGVINIGNTSANTIGNMSSTGNITITINAAAPANVYGIYFSGGSYNITINNNSIGGINTIKNLDGEITFEAISNNASSITVSCQNNTIGGDISNSIQVTNSDNAGVKLSGISSSNSSVPIITNNIVRHLQAVNTNSASPLVSVVKGISLSSSSTDNLISQNTIHSLGISGASTAANTLSGISSNSSGSCTIEKNFLHSYSSSQNQTTLNGILAGSGTVTYKNNFVRLGIGSSGSSISTGSAINGINETGGANNFYFNSVYVGGNPASGSLNTFAFQSSVTTTTRRYYDNIFFNSRSNSGSTGKHYSIAFGGTSPNPAALSSNYNILYANGNGSVLGFFNGIDRTTLNDWRSATAKDSNSIYADPQFSNPTGDTGTVNLHIGTNSSPAEGIGIDVGSVTDDFDGQIRFSLSPTDIGADAGNFTSPDVTAPSISYIPLGGDFNTSSKNFSGVIIADSSAVNGNPGTRPRCYYKRSTDANIFNDNTSGTGGWKYSEATGSVSPFDFVINYSLLNGGVDNGSIIQYFVVAQDMSILQNVGINSGIFAVMPTSVNLLPNSFPITGTINSYSIGRVTIAGALSGNGAYLTLSSALSAINSASQTNANIVINIHGNTTEPVSGATLNEGSWSSLRISPQGGVPRIISSAISPGSALINLNGADNVTIDGLNSGGDSLTLTNTSASNTTGTSTIKLTNDASNNIITQCKILGSALNSSSSAINGVGNIYFGSGTTTGNDNNLISFCDIGPAGANPPGACITSSGSTDPSSFNTGDTIRNCTVYGYIDQANRPNAGIYLGTGSSDFSIKDNKFFQPSAISQLSSHHSAIWINNTDGNNFNVSGNIIGYSSSAGTGTYNYSAGTSSFFYPIYLSVGSATPTSVQGNTIAGISISGSLVQENAVICIYLTSGIAEIGNITGNLIGSMSDTGSIAFTTNFFSNTCGVTGIYNNNGGNWITNNNSIGGITASNSNSAAACQVYGIRSATTGTWTCSNNLIGGNISNSMRSHTTANRTQVQGVVCYSGTSQVSGNIIRNLTSAAASDPAFYVSVAGIRCEGTGSNTVSGNHIYGLTNIHPSLACDVIGIFTKTLGNHLFSGNLIHSFAASSTSARLYGTYARIGSSTFQNNMIRLGLDTSGNNMSTGCTIEAMRDFGENNNYYFNSVYVGGSASGASSFAFRESGFTAKINILNNIFYNERAPAAHYAIGLTGTALDTSNNNIFYCPGAGGAAGFFNNANQQTIWNWRSSTGLDLNSYENDPHFINPTGSTSSLDLHISNVPSAVEQKGVFIESVTYDYDGDIRASFTPTDIGADAGNFNTTIPLAGDYTIGLNLFNSILGTDITFKGETRKVIKEERASNDKGDGAPFLNTEIVSGEVEEETFISYENGKIYNGPLCVLRNSNPNLPGDAMSGVYATIGAAINDLTLRGVSAPVRFFLLDTEYNSEGLPLPITKWEGVSAVNTVTIKPGTGVTSTISGNNTTSIFNINGADYFIIDGSNINGGISKNLTIRNDGAGTGSAIRFINDAMSDTIRNCILNVTTGSLPNAGTVHFSTTSGTSGNDSNVILNNEINGNARWCIYNSGTGTTTNTKNSGNKIIGNKLSGFRQDGINDEGNSAGTLYQGNEIFASTFSNVSGFRVAATTIEGFTFRNNYIHNLIGGEVNGIDLVNIQPGSVGSILNNFITITTTTPIIARGIYDRSISGARYDIYFNSIYIDGTYPDVGVTFSSDCYLRSVSSNTNFKNNILVNARTGGNGPHHAIRTVSSVFSFISDYNDIFNTGGTANGFGRVDNTFIPDLSAWRSATGKDLNSVSGDPKYISANNLHIDTTQTAPVSNAGTPIAGITTDFDNHARSLTTPDIGADEYGQSSIAGTLNLTMIMEGFYDTPADSMKMNDTIIVYLRNSSSPYALVDSAKTIIDANTFTGSFMISNAPTGNYYIVVKHRNTIETWSNSSVSYTSGSTISYNFITSESQAYGNNMKQVDASPVRFGIFSGDVNQDGIVDAGDLSLVDNDAFNSVSGYVNTDVNGDDFVDASDISIVDNNVFNGVIVERP